jgi:molybdopterin-guanine dinucleotide biosynthesis protein A
MLGKNKSFLHLGQTTFLERLVSVLEPLFAELLLVTRDPELYALKHIKVVRDIYDVRSALSGVHAGLVHARQHHAFVVACDTPLLSKDLVERLVRKGNQDDDVVVPRKGRYFEPLCAVYSKSCIPHIEGLLEAHKVKISHLFSLVKTREVDVASINQEDPDLQSFINVNTPEDLSRIQEALMNTPGGASSDPEGHSRP